MIVNKR